MIDFDLTDEQRPIQETTRDFASSKNIPRARHRPLGRAGAESVFKLGEIGGQCGDPGPRPASTQ